MQRNETKQEQEQKISINDDATMVFVGAGPGGLSAAIQLAENANKVNNKSIKIVLLERHKAYERTQTLKLDLTLINNKQIREDILKLIENKIADWWSENDTQFVSIPIQTLELCLLNHIERTDDKNQKKLNIEVMHAKFLTAEQYEIDLKENDVKTRKELEDKLKCPVIIGMEEIKKHFPKCKILVGADGSRSIVRNLISEKQENVSKTDLQNMIEVKYQVHGEAKKLSDLQYYLTHGSLGGFVCTENIKYDESSKISTITLRFLVDKKTYNDERLKSAKAKDPLKLTRDIPYSLVKAISAWVNARDDKNIVTSSATLNKTILSIYTSQKYCSKSDNSLVLLFGDAAAGYPFMNGLNLLLGTAIEFGENFAKIDLSKLDDEQINKIIKIHDEILKKSYEKGMKIVNKTNSKINSQQSVVKVFASSVDTSYACSSFFSSSSSASLKSSILKDRNEYHPIFYTHPSNMLDLDDLYAYMKKMSHKTKLEICDKLSSDIKKANRVEEVKVALCRAYDANKNAEMNKSSSSIFSIFSKGSLKSSTDDKPKKISTVVPEKLVNNDGKQLSQNLHKIIYSYFCKLDNKKDVEFKESETIKKNP